MPLITIVCLCYNHKQFIREAIDSVINQTYKNIEVIIVDDGSYDGSVEIIKYYKLKYPEFKVILNMDNLGNCKAFNQALAIAIGKYIIDFATDDVMLPTKIENQVKAFEQLDESYAVVFTDAVNVDVNSKIINHHYKRNKNNQLISVVPSGDIYRALVQRYFISTPTMMMRKKSMDELGGYDESLAYEDFDFWIRSSRNHKYFYLDEVSMYKRKVADSLSSKFYKSGNYQMLYSTYRVCEKILWLNSNRKEDEVLKKRIWYELKQCLLQKEFSLGLKYSKLLYNLNSLKR